MPAARPLSEAAIHRQCADMLTLYERQGKLYWCPVPNGAWVQGANAAARGRRVSIMKASGMLKPGAPDMIVCIDGRFIGVEIKTDAGRQSDTQREAEAAIDRAGGDYRIVKSLGDLMTILAEHYIGERAA